MQQTSGQKNKRTYVVRGELVLHNQLNPVLFILLFVPQLILCSVMYIVFLIYDNNSVFALLHGGRSHLEFWRDRSAIFFNSDRWSHYTLDYFLVNRIDWGNYWKMPLTIKNLRTVIPDILRKWNGLQDENFYLRGRREELNNITICGSVE